VGQEGNRRFAMNKLSHYRVLISGVLSPFAAILLYALTYTALTWMSADFQKDWLFRLSVATAAMTVPFFVTLALAAKEGLLSVLSRSAKVGVILAILSLALTWKPISDGILRSRQVRDLAMRNVAAPVFDTTDVRGNHQRLEDQKGRVVLVNIWATWCGPCRAEMPKLDQLYREHKNEGLVVFGLSDEDTAAQLKYLKEIPVTYPLLTMKGNVPGIYRDIAQYPAIFLIDRQGQLQPAPGPEQPFETLAQAVNELLVQQP
jgi:thiol-disulfide isomerase/thioredoxin